MGLDWIVRCNNSIEMELKIQSNLSVFPCILKRLLCYSFPLNTLIIVDTDRKDLGLDT